MCFSHGVSRQDTNMSSMPQVGFPFEPQSEATFREIPESPPWRLCSGESCLKPPSGWRFWGVEMTVERLHFWRVSSCQLMSLASLDESAGTKTHIRPMWESQSYRHKPYQVARTLPFWRHHKPHLAMVTSSDASFCGTSRDSPWPLGYGGVNWQGAMWKAHGKFCSDNEWSTSGGLSTSNS